MEVGTEIPWSVFVELFTVFVVIISPIQVLFPTEQFCDSVICFTEVRPFFQLFSSTAFLFTSGYS